MSSARHHHDDGDFAVRTHIGSQTVIAVRGELDLATVEIFELAYEAIELATVGRVLLDLQELTFIDISGLRAVLRLRERCVRQSVALLVRPGARMVRRMFELTGADCLLLFEQSELGQ